MKTLGDHLKSILVGDSSPSPRATVKVTQTPIAWWDPTTKKGGRLTVFRSVSSRSGTSYSYKWIDSRGLGRRGHRVRRATHRPHAVRKAETGWVMA